jgi:tetratricopeptide (TPR) repeat protein
MFLSLAAVLLFCRYIRLRWLQALLLAVVVMAGALGTFERNKVWQDELIFYRDCLKKSPNKARPHDGLGSAFLKRGRVEEAIAHFKKSLQLDPKFAPAHNNLGVALIRLEKFSLAIDHFQEALHLMPGYVDAFNNLTKLEKNLQIDEKIKSTRKELERHPDDSSIHYDLGILYASRGKMEEAKTHYQKSLELDSGNHDALTKLACTYAQTGQYNKAISLFQEVIARQPENPDTFFYIASIYAKQNKKMEAVDWLKKAVERGYRNPEIFKNGLDPSLVLRSVFEAEK